jgi:PAS domain S-box-containing protein
MAPMSPDDLKTGSPKAGDVTCTREQRLLAALRQMDRLHEFSASATRQEDLDRVPEMALDAAMETLRADFGNVQFYEPESRSLRIVAHRGFDQALDRVAVIVVRDGSVCARAMARREPVASQDLRTEPRASPDVEAVRRSMGYRSVLSSPMFSASGALLGMLSVHFRAVEAIDDDTTRLARLLAREIARAIDRTRAEITLRESEDRLALVLESARIGTFEWRSKGNRVTLSKLSEEFLGFMPGRRDNSVHPDDRASHKALFREASSRGTDYRTVYRIIRQIDGKVAWIEERGRGFRDATTGETMIRGVHWDVTERELALAEQKRAQDRQATLLYELQHRVRNVLAMTKSLVGRTMASASSVSEAADVLDGRIDALARTQARLTRAAGAGVDLESVVREELSAQGAIQAHAEVHGPKVQIAPKAAEVLTLAIHELATNSAKYGAIAQNGALSVAWRIFPEPTDGTPWLKLNWSETGVETPSAWKRGFGVELVEQRVPYELNGHGKLELPPGGVACEISFPLIPGESILATDRPSDS